MHRSFQMNSLLCPAININNMNIDITRVNAIAGVNDLVLIQNGSFHRYYKLEMVDVFEREIPRSLRSSLRLATLL